LCSLSFSLADSNSEEARISSDEELAKQVQEELVGSPDLTEEKMVAGNLKDRDGKGFTVTPQMLNRREVVG
jgi:hypothetical protein